MYVVHLHRLCMCSFMAICTPALHRTVPPTLQSGHPTILLSTCEHHRHCQKPMNINISFEISVCVLTCSEGWRLSHALAMLYMCAHPLCPRCISVPSYLHVHVRPPLPLSFHPSVITTFLTRFPPSPPLLSVRAAPRP
jgi:hypothetical protein